MERVCLLSETAEQYISSPYNETKKTSFWSSLINIFRNNQDQLIVKGVTPPIKNEENLKNLGFTPFCKIGNVKIYIKIQEKLREIAIIENDRVWEIDEWGEGSDFKARFIAECYFMVTKDDFQIDANESRVLKALFGCIQPTPEEIADAKGMVYWTLLESVMEDHILTEEEQQTMEKIYTALELSPNERENFHKKAIQDRFEEMIEKRNEQPITEEIIEKIVKMAEIVGIPQEFIEKHATNVRQYISKQ